jgi:DNA primase
MAKAPATEVRVGERTVRISNPDRVYFPATGATKLDLAEYYLAVGPGVVNALRERPCMMHRFPTGVSGEKVHQKRVRPALHHGCKRSRALPRYGLHADELCVTELASVIWSVQMSTVEFHPWNSRRADVEPDEWRIDLDPMPDCPLATVRRRPHAAVDELGAVGWPRRGGRGLHVTKCTSSRRTGSRHAAAARPSLGRSSEARPDLVDDVVAQGPRSRPRCSSTTAERPGPRWRRLTRCGA